MSCTFDSELRFKRIRDSKPRSPLYEGRIGKSGWSRSCPTGIAVRRHYKRMARRFRRRDKTWWHDHVQYD